MNKKDKKLQMDVFNLITVIDTIWEYLPYDEKNLLHERLEKVEKRVFEEEKWKE